MNEESSSGSGRARPSTPSVVPSTSAAAASSSSTGGATESQMETLLSRFHFHQELDRAHQLSKKEEHNKRIKNLRKELDHLSSTEWQYTPIDKLIGQ